MPLTTLFRRNAKENAVTEIAPAAADVVMQFRTQGGATVDLYRHAWNEPRYDVRTVTATVDRTGFEWRCNGCDKTGAETHMRLARVGYEEDKPRKSRDYANAHAETCQAMPRPTT